MEDQFEYDVALSFAGEQREYVERVAKFLKSKDIRVFYDRDVQSVLWGKNLSVALEEIYLDKAQYCIIFISSDYAKKEWTCLEVSAAMERMLHNRPSSNICLPFSRNSSVEFIRYTPILLPS